MSSYNTYKTTNIFSGHLPIPSIFDPICPTVVTELIVISQGFQTVYLQSRIELADECEWWPPLGVNQLFNHYVRSSGGELPRSRAVYWGLVNESLTHTTDWLTAWRCTTLVIQLESFTTTVTGQNPSKNSGVVIVWWILRRTLTTAATASFLFTGTETSISMFWVSCNIWVVTKKIGIRQRFQC